MKKNVYFPLCLSMALLMTGSVAFTKGLSQEVLTRQVSQKVEQTANQNQQVAPFIKNLAQQDPVKLANFLLGSRFAYIYDESIAYLGIRGIDEVLVICKIDDTDVGTFYYVAHKKGNKVTEDSPATMPSTQGFVTLFERK